MATQLALTAALLSALLCPVSSRTLLDPPSALTPKHVSTDVSDVCSKCTEVLLQSNNDIITYSSKAGVYAALLALCGSLSPHQASLCQKQVDSHLSQVLQQSQTRQKSSVNCGVFGLCAETNEEVETEESRNKKDVFGPVCSLCVLVMKKLETLLPKNATEEALRTLLDNVCSLMPQSYKPQCDDFVEKYGDEIIDFLLSSAAPHTICTLLHLCLLKDTTAAPLDPRSDCESCQTLSVLTQVHMSLNQEVNWTKAHSEAFLQSVCANYPQALPKCERFTALYGSQLLKALEANSGHLCQRADLCGPLRVSPAVGARRCTWGPSYWCRDMKTAQECGNQVFCKKFVWK